MTARSTADDHLPTASLEVLQRRAVLLQQLRAFFHARDFIEVETPLLSHDTIVDRHIEPIPVSLCGAQMWLQTSPEFAMKRLVAAGAPAIYQITRAFRDGERGRWHNPEFTMLEWYRVGDNLEQGVALLAELACHVLGVQGVEHLTYQDAFLRYAQLDPLAASTDEISVRCRRQNPAAPECGEDRDDWLNFLLAEVVEPRLGQQRPTILTHYPQSQAALARVSQADARVAERFELYVNGVELANGYHELCDADELTLRMQRANQQRVADAKRPLPEASRLLAAMQTGLPPCTGVALGVDRLHMAREGCQDIDSVVAFPIERA